MRTAIAVFSSGRRNGNTGRLIDHIARELQIEVIDLAEKTISPFDYEHTNRDDDFEALIRHVLDFDQVIFASPIYWYNVASTMKVFIDRLSDLLDVPDLLELGRKLKGKTAHIVCTSINDEASPHFTGMLQDSFRYLGMDFGACLHVKYEDGRRTALQEDEIAAFIDHVRGESFAT